MISLLIPTYNYNVHPLVLELNQQCKQCGIDFQIIVLDDAGTLFFDENQAINSIENCTFTSNDHNIGRSKMRNLLAKKATYNWLLFLDADTIPLHSNFISNYVAFTSKVDQIIYGGIKYSVEFPTKNSTLRWFYGKKREAIEAEQRNLNPYISFLTLNFMIPKAFFKVVQFNEDIPNLRHEDTLFSFELSKKKIPILHIDNPIIHLGLDTNEAFLNKTRLSVIALKNLVDTNLIDANYVRLATVAKTIHKLKLNLFSAWFFTTFKSKMEQQLCSKNPSMFLFDIYRLFYYSTLFEKKNQEK
ncbi:glycosyltransferase family 2 protein [Flavobacterium antarcticum]|uniref:glycosyltransferase family 2 protein n=1 Tax=Flavobacterium antarcticum TaxID=271155 RepID=UPI0003B50BB9|nr:glycosyltransferase [Flavobacterium antarcticum]